MKKKRLIIFFMVVLLCTISGCGKKEITKEEIKSSDMYQDLKIKLDKLQADYDDLEEKMQNMESESPSEVENNEYRTKLTRGGVYKFDIQDAEENQEKVSLSDEDSLAQMSIYMNRADWDTNVDIEYLTDHHVKQYRYVLYDEDNSVYEMSIYDDDYLVFDDLQDKVFYAKGVSSFGNAFFTSNEYRPHLSLVASLYESALFFVDDRLYDKQKAQSAIAAFEALSKNKKKNIECKEENLKKTMQGRRFGTVYEMKIYKKAIVLSDDVGNVEYYKVTSEDSKEFLKNFEN